MPKINLAQEAIRNQLIARRRRLLYILSVVILVVTVGVYGVALLLTTRVQGTTVHVEEEVTRLQAQLDARKDDVREIVLFRERLKSLESILATHIRWSHLLEELERLSVPSATFLSLKGGVGDKSLTAEVRLPSLDAAADLVASLQNRGEPNETFFPGVTVAALKPLEVSAQPGVAATVAGYTLTLRLTTTDAAFQAPQEVPAAPPVPVPALPGAAVPPAEGATVLP